MQFSGSDFIEAADKPNVFTGNGNDIFDGGVGVGSQLDHRDNVDWFVVKFFL